MSNRFRKLLRSMLIVSIAVLSMAGVLSAQSPLTAEDGVIVAEGFHGPQGVLVDSDGNIWVIDSGLGGEDVIPWVTPEGQIVDAQFGQTAQVIKVAPDGTQEVVAVLPSVFTGAEAIGGARLALLDGVLYATSGQGIGDPTIAAPENTGAVVKIVNGEVTEVANLWDFERTENPDPALFDSHPYGLAAGPDGMLYVADAGANDLLKVDPATGEVTLLAVFAPIPGVFPRPDLGGELLTDAVPTGVVVDEDGVVYVSYLSGVPFVPGSAKVVMVDVDGEVSNYATGLTMLTDLQRGPDGHLYAVQFGIFTDQGPTPDSGAVLRIAEGDGSQEVITGLSFPTGISFDAEGNLYVVVNGVGAPGSGAVVKFEGVAHDMMMGEEAMATPAATEEAAEEAMAEATPVPTEEAAEETTPTPAATEEPTEEASPSPTEEPREEATPAPTEEPIEETTPVPTEEAMAEAPTTLPVTGGASTQSGAWLPFLAAFFVVLTGGLLWKRGRSVR